MQRHHELYPTFSFNLSSIIRNENKTFHAARAKAIHKHSLSLDAFIMHHLVVQSMSFYLPTSYLLQNTHLWLVIAPTEWVDNDP